MIRFRPPPLRAADDRTTSAAKITLRQSIYPLALVTILFAYGLLDVLNKHFQNTLNITRSRSAGLQAAYFGAYPVASLTYAGWVLRKFGYRATFIMGLVMYGVGALLFWPSAHYRSFGGFCGATFVIGSGLGTLETAANPYLAVCGPPKYSEIRLNIAQALNGVGTVVGPVLASYVFFKDVNDDDLTNVQYVYLAIALFVFILAVVFLYSNIPEITDADMQQQADDSGNYTEHQDKSIWQHKLLWWAVAAQFCYVGAQVGVASSFVNYATEVSGKSASDGASFFAVAQGLFTIGRFSGSFLMKFIRPRKVFLVYFTMVIVFSAASIGARGDAGLAMMMLVLFFESICFPTIFTLGLRGLGRHTKKGASYIVASLIGAAIVPPILLATADYFDDTGRAQFINTIFFVVGVTFAFGVNFHKGTKALVDGFSDSKVGLEGKDPEAGMRKERQTEARGGEEKIRR
ncbi:major facilitator superfamily domain-containing protein [Pterulicium gracile]|uniref:Major facilitator superfamily domain-containing protein n=1 Tax=Pterulicium gracile TaxID=1884261 RepID=A0A5C3QF44_9AGAR|nr:major facilitator superfamily domain-containing protein [Pterula gracilis]